MGEWISGIDQLRAKVEQEKNKPPPLWQAFNPFDPEKFKTVLWGIGTAQRWMESKTLPITEKWAPFVGGLGEPQALTRWKEQYMPTQQAEVERKKQEARQAEPFGGGVTYSEAVNRLLWGVGYTYVMPAITSRIASIRALSGTLTPGKARSILGVSKNATQVDIKAAFRAQAFKYHPDTSTVVGAEAKFKEAAAAYEVLTRGFVPPTGMQAGTPQLASQLGGVSKEVGPHMGVGAAGIPPPIIGQLPENIENTLLPVLRGEVPVENLETLIRRVYTPEKAEVIRKALSERLSGLYDQVQAREGLYKGNLPAGRLITREQFGEVVDRLNSFFRALNKVEATPSGQLPSGTVPPVKPVAEPPIRVTPTGEPIVRMATNTQKIDAHNIAKTKALIDPKTGEMRPTYRRLATLYTGQRSMLKMTEEQADLFLEVLKRLPEPTYNKLGKLVPPSIPTTTRVVPEGFFERKYGEPTLVRLFTSQVYYSEVLGVKPLVEALEAGKFQLDLTYRNLAHLVEKQIGRVNKVWGTSKSGVLSAKMKNQPTKAVMELRDALDAGELPPDSMSLEQAEEFLWFRNLNRTILRWENEIRVKVGLEPIPYRKAYVRHVAERTRDDILWGRRDLPEGLKYWSKQVAGKKIFNDMAMQRKLADDLEGYFTKDLEFATKSMLWTALRSIYLDQPLKLFNQQLNAIGKDLHLYKGLTEAETEAMKRITIIPASTRDWMVKYVNQAIKGQQTGLDEEVNRMFLKSGMAGLMDKFLTPFGRTLGAKPFTHLAQGTGRVVISAVIGVRPKMMIRNLFQGLQNLALYGVNSTVRAYGTTPRLAQELMDKSIFLRSYTGLEELPTGAMARAEKAWLAAYQKTAVFNATKGELAPYHDFLPIFQDPKYKNLKYNVATSETWANPNRTYKEPKGFLYPDEKAKLLKEMEWGAGATQYQYTSLGMPEIFRSKTLIPLTRLQSWWMNHFFRFHREAMTRAFTGKTGYGAELPASKRLNYMKYLVLGGAILTAMGYKRSFLLGVLPHYLSPPVQIALGFYNYAVADSDWQRTKALRTIYYSYKAFIPGSLAWQDFSDAWSGKKPMSELFFYGTEEEPIPHKPTWSIPTPPVEKKPTPTEGRLPEKRLPFIPSGTTPTMPSGGGLPQKKLPFIP